MNNITFITKTFHDCGGTFSLIGEEVPETGYLVGGAGTEHKVGADLFTPDRVQAFINENKDLLYSKGYYLGTWLHDGKVYLDVTEHFEHFAMASATAQARDEIAFWDIDNDTERKA